MLISSLSSVAMIASVMPFVYLVANQDGIENQYVLNCVYELLGSPDRNHFLILLGVCAFLIVLSSNALNLLKVYYISKYSHGISRRWSEKLYSLHLNQSYEKFIHLKPAVFIRNSVTEPQEVVIKFLMPLGMMLSSLLTLFLVLAGLLVYSPLITVSTLGIFIFSFLLLSFFIKKKLMFLGKDRISLSTERDNILQESIRCFKDIKMTSCEKSFEKKFNKKAKQVSSVLIYSSVLTQLPRYWLQTIFFGFVLIGCIVLIIISETDKNVFLNYLPTITMFALAGQRLLPEIQTVYTSRNSMLFSLPALKNLTSTMAELLEEEVKDNQQQKIDFCHELSLDNVTFNYGENEVFTKPVNLTIRKGDKIALLGSSGSGKSTLISIIMGLLRPNSGYIKSDQYVINDNNVKSWMSKISQVPQEVSIIDGSLIKNITIGQDEKNIDEEEIWEILELVDLKDWAQNLPEQLNTNIMKGVSSLSGGQQQRIGVARAIYRNGDILILDEATSSLDQETEKRILKIIHDKFKDKTIISITHRPESLKYCNRIIEMNSDGIIRDKLSECNSE